MSSNPLGIATEDLEAWRRGDFDGLKEILDPAVTWHWFEPSGFAKRELSFRVTGEDSIIVVSHPSEIGGPEWPDETATVMRFQDGKVVSMRDYATEAEARAAVRAE